MRVLLSRLRPPLLRRPRISTARLVGGTTIALVIAAAGFVARFGSNVPIMDEWSELPALLDHPFPLDWVFAYHNEHRYWLPRAVWAGLLAATGFDFRAGMAAAVAALGAAAVLLTAAAARARGRASVADIILPVLLLNWGNWFNLLMGYQLAFALILLCAAGLVWQAVRADPGREGRAGLWAGAWLVALTGTGGFGLAFVPPVGVWLGYLAVRAWRAGRRAAAVGLLAAPAVAAVYSAATLAAMPAAPPGVSPPALVRAAAAADYLVSAVGPAGWHPAPLRWALVAALTAAHLGAIGLAVRAAVRSPAERPRALGLLAVLAGHLAVTAGIAWTRPNPLSDRFVTTAAVGPVVCWLIAARYGPGRPRWGWVVAAGAAVLAVANGVVGHDRGTHLWMTVRGLRADVRAGMPPEFLTGKHGWKSDVFAYNQGSGTPVNTIRALRDRGHAVFRAAAADPPLTAVPAGVAVPLHVAPVDPFAYLAGGAAPVVVPIPPPGQAVTGLRVAVEKPGEGGSVVRLRWTGGRGPRTDAASGPILPAAAVLTFWMPGEVPTGVTLEVACPDPGLTVRRVEWVFPNP